MAESGHPATAASGSSPADGSRPDRAVYQTPAQALAQAASTGEPVTVTGATTATSTLTANPDGTLALTENAAPVRTQVGGTWRDLNPDLVRNADGTWSPAVSSTSLALSGGGTSPLATMTDGSYSLSVSAPMALPAPSVSGATATYADVLPGVDLMVTAKAAGGYSEALRVNNRAAAADPGLASLDFTTKTTGLTLATVAGGAISAATARGQVVFSAPEPQMWDSSVAASAKGLATSATSDAPGAGLPLESSADGPAPGAKTAPIGVSLDGSSLTLAPSQGLLNSPDAVFPEYIDPNWDPAGSPASSWAYVSSGWPTTSYYDGSNFLQVGVDPDLGNTSYSFYSLPISDKIRGAYIWKATAYFPEVWADSCAPSPVDLYSTGAISSSTTYDNQPSWGTKLGSENVAYGWNSADQIGGTSTCASGAKDVFYDVTSVVDADSKIKSGAIPALTVGLKAESAGAAGWKLFASSRSPIDENASITIQYAFTPTTPVLSTSGGADCAKGMSVEGDGNITLVANTQDADGFPPTVSYTVYAAGNPSDVIATKSNLSSADGASFKATLQLSASTLESADTHYGANGSVVVNWTASAQVSGLSQLPASGTASCKFTFSTSKPGMPNVNDSTGTDCNTTAQAFTVGTQATLTATGNATPAAPANPTSYTYQLNGGSPITVTAASSPPYAGSIVITPTRVTNVLTVAAIAAGNSVGQTYTCWINAKAPAAAADQDMTGDDIADLLAVGNGTTGIAPGLWLAAGKAGDTASAPQFDGTIATNATDIGPYGPQGLGTSESSVNPGTPSDWAGLKAITGQFVDSSDGSTSTNPGFNDIEAYNPGTDQVFLLQGQGDGSIAASSVTNLTNILTSQPYTDSFGDQVQSPDYPQQLVNAYDVSVLNTPDVPASAFPDQIGVFTDPNAAFGSYLAFFRNSDGPNSFDAETVPSNPYMLTNSPPPTNNGSASTWADWTITTDYRPGAAYPDMYLWNQATGDLYLWQLTGLEDVVVGGWDGNTGLFGNSTATLDYNQTNLGALPGTGTWNKGTSLAALQAADIGGNPGLMALTSTGQVQSWELAGTSFTQVNATGSSQALLTADHTYLLNDNTGSAVSVAADSPGAGDTEDDLGQTAAASQPVWEAGGMFSPDASFDGTSDFLSSTSQTTFNVGSDFTVSAWVNLSALGGTVFSKNGASVATVKVGSNTNGTWFLSVNTGGSSYDTVNVGTARAGIWTNLALTFDTSSQNGIYRLYANGTEIGLIDEATPPTSAGRLVIGASQGSGGPGNFLSGQAADIQVWKSLAIPDVAPSAASAFVPVSPVRIMDTRSASKIGSVTGPLATGTTISVPIAGASSIPSNGVTAVAVSFTVSVDTGRSGYITAFADGTDRPDTSTLNFTSTHAVSNSTIVPLGPDGKIAVNVSGASIEVIIDVTGYFTTSTATAGASTYTPLPNSSRILLTSNGTGVPQAQVQPNSAIGFHIADDNGTTGAPITTGNVTAVALNIGAIAPSGDNGFIEAYPDTTSLHPLQTLVSFAGPQTSATTAIIPVNTSNGKIDLYNGSASPIDLVGDLAGYFTTSTSGQYFHAIDPVHVIDTRTTGAGPIAAGQDLTAQTTPAGITADNPTLDLNVTASSPAGSGHLKAYPASQQAPGTSILNFGSGDTVAAMALVNTATQNNYVIENDSTGAVDVIIAITGYFN